MSVSKLESEFENVQLIFSESFTTTFERGWSRIILSILISSNIQIISSAIKNYNASILFCFNFSVFAYVSGYSLIKLPHWLLSIAAGKLMKYCTEKNTISDTTEINLI